MEVTVVKGVVFGFLEFRDVTYTIPVCSESEYNHATESEREHLLFRALKENLKISY